MELHTEREREREREEQVQTAEGRDGSRRNSLLRRKSIYLVYRIY